MSRHSYFFDDGILSTKNMNTTLGIYLKSIDAAHPTRVDIVNLPALLVAGKYETDAKSGKYIPTLGSAYAMKKWKSGHVDAIENIIDAMPWTVLHSSIDRRDTLYVPIDSLYSAISCMGIDRFDAFMRAVKSTCGTYENIIMAEREGQAQSIRERVGKFMQTINEAAYAVINDRSV